MAQGPHNANEKWRPGTDLRGNKTYAQLSSGRWLVVRIRNSITGQYRVTPNGEDYYRNNRQEFIFQIPVVVYRSSIHYPYWAVAYRTYINVTEEEMDDPSIESHNLHGLFGAGRVRDRLMGPAEVQTFIAEAVHLYISNIVEEDAWGRKVLLNGSDTWFCYDDARPIQFSEQIVRHIRDDGTPVIENILDRPLQGFPALPPNMYQKLGLYEEATHDLRNSGGCMVAQIFECAKQRAKVGRTGSGKMGTMNSGTWEQQRVFKDHKEIEDLFDQIFLELYPGEPVDPDAEALDGVEVKRRAYPYEF
jgi:hypothetical protein